LGPRSLESFFPEIDSLCRTSQYKFHVKMYFDLFPKDISRRGESYAEQFIFRIVG
jgi:hypothetical protein